MHALTHARTHSRTHVRTHARTHRIAFVPVEHGHNLRSRRADSSAGAWTPSVLEGDRVDYNGELLVQLGFGLQSQPVNHYARSWWLASGRTSIEHGLEGENDCF